MDKLRRFHAAWVICALSLAVAAPIAPARAGNGVTLPMGTPVEVELLHHVTSEYSPPGSKVYLGVTEDVTQDGALLIRAATVVVGTVEQAQKSKAMGRGGSLSISARGVEAVDATLVPLDAELEVGGRTRTGATVGMVVAFGLPGLFTKGRMAFLEKGTVFRAFVLTDREVDPTSARPLEGAASPAEHLSSLEVRPKQVKLAIEKGKKLPSPELIVHPPGDLSLQQLDLHSLRLLAVDGTTIPEEIEPRVVSTDRVIFDGWSLLKYCHDGANSIELLGNLRDGSRVSVQGTLTVKIKKKES